MKISAHHRELAAVGLALATTLAFAAPAAAQTPYDGDWEGVLHAGPQNLRLELDIETEGGRTGTVLTSLDQGTNIPSTAVKIEDGELGILFLAAAGELKGRVSPDGKAITGSWTQGVSLPLTLNRKRAAPKP
jgi:hypothetical protein